MGAEKISYLLVDDFIILFHFCLIFLGGV